MKKTILLPVIIMAFAFAACNNTPKTNSTEAESTPSEETKSEAKSEVKSDCLIGTWGFTENNFEMTFTFNEDKTGTGVSSAEEVRPFTWNYKDGNPVIIYDGEATEWQFTLDCENKELTIMSIIYKKK